MNQAVVFFYSEKALGARWVILSSVISVTQIPTCKPPPRRLCGSSCTVSNELTKKEIALRCWHGFFDLDALKIVFV